MTARTFGQWLTRYMTDQNPPIEATELARRVGVSPSTVSRWKDDKTRPDPDTLTALADVLSVDLGELYVLAGYGRPAATVTAAIAALQPIDPLAVEIDRMLRPDSPLDDDVKDALREFLTRLIAPHRRDMRKRRSA